MKHAIEHLQEEYRNAKAYAESGWRGDEITKGYREKAIDLADALTALGVPTKHPLHVYQVRAIQEKKELDERLTKLAAFIKGEAFQKLTEEESEDLCDQHAAMLTYSAVLERRIGRF